MLNFPTMFSENVQLSVSILLLKTAAEKEKAHMDN
jgi:hypothetical protein